MPRVRTDAAERTRQNHRLVEQVEAELGRKVSVKEAQDYRRAQATKERFPGRIIQREIDFGDRDVRYLGQLLAQVEDFKVIRGTTANLTLTTSPEFRHLLLDASVISRHSMLVAVLYEVPRNHGLDDPEIEGGDAADQETPDG